MQPEVMVQKELVDHGGRAAADLSTPGAFFSLAMMPGQFNDLTRGNYYPDGERRLLVAVLDTAVHDYLANANPKTAEQRMRFAEVNYWMNQHSASPRLFSYQWLCEALEIDPSRLRKRLDSLRRHGTSSRLSSIGAAAGHYRSVRKITARQSPSSSTRGHRRSSLG